MKHNKKIFPLVLCGFMLTSCGLGEPITKESFQSNIANLSSVNYTSVNISGTLSTRFVEVESNITLNYNFVFNGETFVADVENDITPVLKTFLGVRIQDDFNKSLVCETAVYYSKGENAGYSISFTVGDPDTNVSSESAEFTYQYNASGYYTTVYEKETYINNGLTYSSVLELSFNWKK